jgi:putative membrane-bound dehydrogenase-like protein
MDRERDGNWPGQAGGRGEARLKRQRLLSVENCGQILLHSPMNPSARSWCWSSASTALACLLAGQFWSVGSAADFSVQGQRFTVPDGFEVTLAAGADLVPRPVSASFDDQGRLYVTDSSGSNEAPQKQLANPTHRILRLEDREGDGRFDHVSVFADKVMFPQGCLWLDGSVYVAAPPSIWKFTDTDGDGVADRREEWFKGGTLTGCANDIHGPYLGPDGYLYWTKGAFSEQTHTLGNGRILKDRAAHIYRARPDGSDLGVVLSGGMDNPVEIAFTAEGETVFTSTFIDFSQPGFRDGIGHAVYGGVFGKVNEVLDDGRVKRTGPDLLHPFYQAGPAAECGLTRYQGDVFGADHRDNLFATSFNLHKVTRHVLRPSGGTYASTDSDFLMADSQDFHPTDVLEDADGSLLVVDTGGWYKLCCPSSQLSKPEILGGIYRVRKTGAPRLAGKDLKAAYLRTTQPPALADSTLAVSLRRAVWRNSPTNAPWFREILARSGENAAVGAESAHEARIAAEGLGRLRDAAAIPVLLEAIRQGPKNDVVYQHSLVYALIEIAAPAATRAGLSSGSTPVQRAALIALDQMDGSDLRAIDGLPFLRSPDEGLRSAALWVFGHRPEWATESAGLADDLLTAPATTPEAKEEKAALLRMLAVAPAVQARVARRIAAASPDEQLMLFKAVSEAHPKEVSAEWIAAVGSALRHADPRVARASVSALRGINGRSRSENPLTAELKPLLSALAADPTRPADLRLEALLATTGKIEVTNPALLELAIANLDSAQLPAIRADALAVLQRADLNASNLEKVADAIPRVSPIELLRLLAVFDQQSDPALGSRLLAGLRASKAARSLPAGNVRALFAKYPSAVQTEAADFLQSLNTDVAKQSARLDALLAELTLLKGDTRRGQAVFNSAKAACTACHKLGYLGGSVGPDLTSVGQSRTERDLLESIVYPSASFVRSYEPVTIVTKAGDEFSGVLRRDNAEEVVIVTGPGPELRLARADVAEMRPGTISVMPQGLDEQLSKPELADLVVFLKNTKWGPQ